MTNQANEVHNGQFPVPVVLHGGPDDLPETARRQAADGRTTIKVEHRGGYEHFELIEDAAGAAPAAYRWTMRTRIAE